MAYLHSSKVKVILRVIHFFFTSDLNNIFDFIKIEISIFDNECILNLSNQLEAINIYDVQYMQ